MLISIIDMENLEKIEKKSGEGKIKQNRQYNNPNMFVVR